VDRRIGASIVEMAVKSSYVPGAPEVRLKDPCVKLAVDAIHVLVFHPKCHGITQAQLRKTPGICCPQHKCSNCERSTAEAGGMLYR